MYELVLQNLQTLIGYRDADGEILRRAYPVTSTWADEFVRIFYDTLFAYPPTARVFREGERAEREQTLREWYLRVVRGDIDEEFWRWQWRVGLIHIYRKVTNDFMLGMMSLVQQAFLQKCMAAFPSQEAVEVFLAFKRVTDVISGLIAEGYMRGYQMAMKDLLGFRTELLERMLAMESQSLVERLERLTMGAAGDYVPSPGG